MKSTTNVTFLSVLSLLLFVVSNGFIQSPFLGTSERLIKNQNPSHVGTKMAGFGAPDGNKKKAKESKLKPKQQWDRYSKLKNEIGLRVGVRIEGTDSKWFKVGRVKSKAGAYPEMAVARHRGLIAEHARRLFPLQIPTSAKVEWAFSQEGSEEKEGSEEQEESEEKEGSEEWVKVDRSVLTDAPEGLEKLIGFEGTPDPATGYYCRYKEGKVNNKNC